MTSRLRGWTAAMVVLPALAFTGSTAPAAAQTGIVPVEEAALALSQFLFQETLLERCGEITGDVDGYTDAWWEWYARNTYIEHLASVVLAHYGRTFTPERQRPAAESAADQFFARYENHAETCAAFRSGIYRGIADFDSNTLDRLMESDRIITELNRQ
jgi:hypothetical protein